MSYEEKLWEVSDWEQGRQKREEWKERDEEREVWEAQAWEQEGQREVWQVRILFRRAHGAKRNANT